MRKNLFDASPDTPGDESRKLKELIDNYIADKQKESEIKSRTSEENKQIKRMFTAKNIKSFDGDTGTVKLTVEKHESFREDDLIEFLKESGFSDDIVKTKEYIDFDVLESAMYHETIPMDVQKKMSEFKDVSEVVKLRISKKKGE